MSLSVRTQVLSFHLDLACCSPWRSWSLVQRDIVRNRPAGHQYHPLSFAQTCGKATVSLLEALDGVPEGALVPHQSGLVGDCGESIGFGGCTLNYFTKLRFSSKLK